MASANITMGVNGIDKTGAAFNSIRNRAKATGAQIRSVMGGAIAAAGAYLSLKSINGAFNDLAKMSDLAMRAGTSVEFLTKSVTAFKVAGLGIDAEGFVQAMDFMQKNTGKQGEGAFFDVLKQLSAIPDAGERARAAVGVFGRSWTAIAPLINAGGEAVSAIQELIDLMPGMSAAAAKSGKEARDAISVFTTGIHHIFLKTVGSIFGMWSKHFPGGVRAGALNAISAIEWFAKMIKAYIAKAAGVVGSVAGLIFDGFVPALQMWGASLLKTFTAVYDTIKLLGSSIASVTMLAVDAVTKGPAAAWEVFKGTMSAAVDDWKKNITDTSTFDKPIAQMKQAWDVFKGTVSAAENDFTSTVAAANKEREEYLAKLKSNDVGKLFDALQNPTGAAIAGEAFGAAAAKRISNALILGGSNQANKLAILGPQYQNEQRKTNEWLAKIAKNTEKTAENTEEGGDNLAATDL